MEPLVLLWRHMPTRTHAVHIHMHMHMHMLAAAATGYTCYSSISTYYTMAGAPLYLLWLHQYSLWQVHRALLEAGISSELEAGIDEASRLGGIDEARLGGVDEASRLGGRAPRSGAVASWQERQQQ
eukprot:scaffold93614_cov60-Phaeocystis_antarctica.AAC.1